MSQLESELSDRQIGAGLSDDDVAYLRIGVERLRARDGLTLDRLAHRTGASTEALRNFVYRRARRPDNELLGRLKRHLESAEPAPG